MIISIEYQGARVLGPPGIVASLISAEKLIVEAKLAKRCTSLSY